MKRIARLTISLVLMVAIIVASSLNCLAFGAKTEYIKELKIAYGKSAEDAQNQLKKAGYTVLSGNFNEDADTALSKKAYSYIGYKTTTKAEEAITDVAMLSEQVGYSIADIDEIVGSQQYEYKELAENEMVLIEQFREDYNANKLTAVAAKESLDNYIEDDSNTPLGDFLLNEHTMLFDVYKMIAQISLPMFNLMTEVLVSAVTEEYENSFLARTTNLTEAEVEKAKADKSYYDDALEIYTQLPAIKEEMLDLEEYEKKEKKDDKDLTDEDKFTILEYSKKLAVKVQMNSVAINGKTLYDIIMADSINITDIYPIISTLTDYQRAAIKLTGFYILLQNAGNDIKSLNDKSDDVIEEANEKSDLKPVSVYYGVDRSMFKTKVAVTSEASRQMNATNDTSPLFGNVNTGVEIGLHIAAGISLVSGITLLMLVRREIPAVYRQKFFFSQTSTIAGYEEVSGANELLAEIKRTNLVTKPKEIKASVVKDLSESSVSESSIIEASAAEKKVIEDAVNNSEEMQKMFGKVDDTVLEKSQVVKSGAEYGKYGRMQIAGYVLIAVAAIIEVTLLVMNLINYYNPEHVEIPKFAIDKKADSNGNITYTKYQGVTTVGGEMGDLNAMVGKKWNAVYTTKDKAAGKPIQKGYIVQKYGKNEKAKAPSGSYVALHNFGETAAANTNGYAFGDDKGISVFFAYNAKYNNNTATVIEMNTGYIILTGVCGLIIGSVVTVLVSKRKRRNEK